VFVFNFAQFVPQLKAALGDVPVVLDMQSYWLSQLDATWVRDQVSDVDLIVGASDDVRKRIVDRFPDLAARTGTVYNGVDTDHFTPPTVPRQPGSRVLFVGRVSPEKGVHLLVQALPEVARAFPDVVVDIVGPSWVAPREFIATVSEEFVRRMLAPYYDDPRPYLEQLTALVKELGLGAHVRFLDQLAHERLLQAYHDADVLVNPSLSETFGMALVEAGACAVPVVASRTGGMQEIVVDGETGLLVEPGNVPALAGALKRVLGDVEARVRMGAAGRQRAVERFSWDCTADSLVDQYERLGGRLSGVAARWRAPR
jgi:glycosyltransferase involved in cell wall biosynthesis